MCDMCDTHPVCDIDPLYMAQVRVDTSGGRGFVVDMAEYGDTLEKIAADEIKRLREIPEVWEPIRVQGKTINHIAISLRTLMYIALYCAVYQHHISHIDLY